MIGFSLLCFGTVHILRQHNLGLFLTHPLCQHKYSTECQQNWLFSRHPPTKFFADVIHEWFLFEKSQITIFMLCSLLLGISIAVIILDVVLTCTYCQFSLIINPLHTISMIFIICVSEITV